MIASLLSFALALVPQEEQTSTPEVLSVGHVIEARGALDADGRFVADKLELLEADEDDVLIGEVASSEKDPETFLLLGQPVVTDEATRWQGLERGSLAGQRVKVEGSWKGPRRFSAKSIAARGAGRDRVAGRIDELRRVEGGWEAQVMIFTVLLRDDTPVEHTQPVEHYALAPVRKIGRSDPQKLERDEDDSFGKGIPLTDTLRLMGQLEGKYTSEKNYDLDSASTRDRTDEDFPVRLRFAWTPSEKLVGVWELRYTQQYRHDQRSSAQGGDLSEINHAGAFGETWLQWRDAFGRVGFDVTAGRQDFDDPREWISDQNLDAVRLSWLQPAWRFEVALATVLSDGSERDQHSNNATAYLSTTDSHEHLALWSVYRDIDQFQTGSTTVPDEKSWHIGARAIGDWIPDNSLWADFAYQRADRPIFDNPLDSRADVSAWAYDVGTTWSPDFADPLYFTVGYALARGRGDNGTFRQTGFQDNTDRFGGVTSFQYYGELINPELSNLGILTLGVGAIVAERTSLDLVFHTYTQDVARAEFSPLPNREADLKATPNGSSADLGWEADLIFGFRRFKNLDVEIVGATFQPGDGFDVQDDAYLLKVQLRYRF